MKLASCFVRYSVMFSVDMVQQILPLCKGWPSRFIAVSAFQRQAFIQAQRRQQRRGTAVAGTLSAVTRGVFQLRARHAVGTKQLLQHCWPYWVAT